MKKASIALVLILGIMLIVGMACDYWEESVWMENIGNTISECRQECPPLFSAEPRFADSEVNPYYYGTPHVYAGYCWFEGTRSDGGWFFIDLADWELPGEINSIDEENRPQAPSDIAYIFLISKPKRVSAGFYVVGSESYTYGDPEEKFVSEYTVYMIDWRTKELVLREILHSSVCTFGRECLEKQNDYRLTIANYIHYLNACEY